jgi:hypothetical protein
MLLKISLDGPDASSEALADLARSIDAKLPNRTPSDQAADGTHAVRVGPADVTPLFNVVTGFLLDRSADLAVVISDGEGISARLDRETASSPLLLLSALVLFNPPVGLG